MKIRNLRLWPALAMAAVALATNSALAQTNTLPGTYVYPLSSANTSKPGFIWNVYQIAGSAPANLAFFESELVGDQGENLADPTETYSSAAGPGVVTATNAPVTFIVTNAINFNINASVGNPDCSDNRQDLPCEDGLVGTPGNPPDANNGTDNIAGEAWTYLSLPEGPITMGVRSDDGFRLQIGAANPADRYSTNAMIVDQFNGGRSYADSIVTFIVPKAGIYAARLLYFQQSSSASVEWYSFPPAGSSNGFLGTLNTGTNAVLVGDVADGGIPAYQSITTSSLASYLTYIEPTPGATGISLEPVVKATIVNGTGPVSNVMVSIDGITEPATVTTTSSGVSVMSVVTNPLVSNLSTHALNVSWEDDGTELGVTSDFSTLGFITLDSATAITPDTTKPGFKFNIFANGNDPYVASAGGYQGGETGFLDNIELGLNGLVPDGNGGILPNEIIVGNIGAAAVAAPALAGPNAPAEFIITNTINLTAGNLPGFPANDGGSDPTHAEILTYVNLPSGLTTFDLNLDGWYRAFAGSWDYTKATQAGSIDTAASGDTLFSVYAATAGYYPIRVTVMNTDGAPQYSLYTINSSGDKVLVNDIANGGLKAYYAQSTPEKPYIRYVSPRNVLHQMFYPYTNVIVRVQDGDVQANDSSIVFNLDGKTVTTASTRIGDVTQCTWNATTLQVPSEIHTGILTYQDSTASAYSNEWMFQSLKAIYLPTAIAGYWLPTNAVTTETFQEDVDPTAFTNDTPTPGWYRSPQPENPLVDTAPIWTNTPTGPTNWYVWNWDAPGDGTAFDDTDPNSGAYANFLCVDLNTFSSIEGDSLNTAPFESINGVPLISLVYDPSKNVLIAESDNRSNDSPGQTQFGMSKRFDLSTVANPVLAYASIQKQNQDNINAVEYSVDGGVTWLPVFYCLDGHELASDPADLQLNPDNTVDVNATLFSDGSNPGEIPTWTDSTGDVNQTFASALAAPISQYLAPFFAPRINDDKFEGKRIEVVRLPLAAHQSNVRLRVAQIATCSWYFGLSQIAFFDVPPSGAIVPTGLAPTTASGPTLSISVSAGSLNLSWTGSATLQSATSLTGNASDWSNVTPAPTGTTYSAPIGSGSKFFRLISN